MLLAFYWHYVRNFWHLFDASMFNKFFCFYIIHFFLKFLKKVHPQNDKKEKSSIQFLFIIEDKRTKTLFDYMLGMIIVNIRCCKIVFWVIIVRMKSLINIKIYLCKIRYILYFSIYFFENFAAHFLITVYHISNYWLHINLTPSRQCISLKSFLYQNSCTIDARFVW